MPSRARRLSVELRIMPKQVLVVEVHAPAGGHVACNSRPREYRVVQSEEPRAPPKRSAAGGGESVAQSGNDLSRRQIGAGQAASHHPWRMRIELEDALEVSKEFRHPHPKEILGAPFGRRPLFLIGVAVAQRVMRAKNLDIEIEDGQYQLVRPEPSLLIRRREFQTLAEEQQDVGGLSDVAPAGAEDRRSKRRTPHAPGFEYLEYGRHTSAVRCRHKGHIDVPSSALFQREAYEFAASLNARPVIERVVHGRNRRALGRRRAR